MYGTCADCELLDKSRKKAGKNPKCYLYGCNKTKNGYVCGWCQQDKELKLQGCSFYQPPQPKQAIVKTTSEQLSIFDLFKEISI